MEPEWGLVGNIVAAPDDRVIERLHSDMHYLYANVPTDVIQEDENTKIWPFYFGMRIKSVGRHDMIDFTNPPMAHMTTEKDIEEYSYWPDLNTNIMDGVVEFRSAEQTHLLEKGDSLYFDSSIPHALRGIDGIAKSLIVIYSSK